MHFQHTCNNKQHHAQCKTQWLLHRSPRTDTRWVGTERVMLFSCLESRPRRQFRFGPAPIFAINLFCHSCKCCVVETCIIKAWLSSLAMTHGRGAKSDLQNAAQASLHSRLTCTHRHLSSGIWCINFGLGGAKLCMAILPTMTELYSSFMFNRVYTSSQCPNNRCSGSKVPGQEAPRPTVFSAFCIPGTCLGALKF